jgi:hypothetical protein
LINQKVIAFVLSIIDEVNTIYYFKKYYLCCEACAARIEAVAHSPFMVLKGTRTTSE